MARIATDYLDRTARLFPDKTAFADEKRSITFSQLQDEAYHIATVLTEKGLFRQPVLVYLEKGVEVISAFEGISYSGNFYSPVDTRMPAERIARIAEKLRPAAVVTDDAHMEEAGRLFGSGILLSYEKMLGSPADPGKVRAAADRVIDSVVLYVRFTSV